MATLQIRDLPGDVYARLQNKARAEHRSMAQQAIVLLKEALSDRESSKNERKKVLSRIENRSLEDTDNLPGSEDLIREDRDR